MKHMLEAIASKKMNRRDFLKGSAVALASVAALGAAGCNSDTQLETTKGTDGQDTPSTEMDIKHELDLTDPDQGGTWKAAACWHNCGGRCVNKAFVVDGVVVRQKTDDSHEDTPDFPQQRGCVRGRSQRKQVYAADRIKHPLKRKHWEPLTGGDKSLRGRDEWEEITWDEALTYVANELKHAKENYGNSSILSEGTEVGRLLNVFGGYTSRWGTGSLGSWALTGPTIGHDSGATGCNDRMDFRNADTVVMIGVNPGWSSAGNPMYNWTQVKKAGAKFIAVDPYYNETFAVLDAEWIPCNPSQDTAFLLGVAYALIETNNIDQEFLNKYTVGFDAEHMPEGEDPKGNFKDYVLGTYDGVPKTPEWAALHSGADADAIRRLAAELDPKKNVCIVSGWAPARTHNSDSYGQIVMTIGAMTGHIGRPGNCTGVSCSKDGGNGGPVLAKAGGAGTNSVKHVGTECINDTQLWTAILDGKYTFTGVMPNGNMSSEPGEVRDIDIHVIYHAGRALLQTRDAMNKGIEAHRKVDFAVAHAQFLTTSAQYCDIILPLDTYWEREGGFLTGNREIVIYYDKVIEPYYEGHSDQWIVKELAKKLGLDEKEVYNISEKQQLFNQIAGAYVIDEDGKTKLPMVTITAEDIAEWGCEGEPQEGQITLKELRENGVYQVKRTPGDKRGYIAFENFIKDPEANPLKSATGKFEIFSRKLSDTINNMGYSKVEPIPAYVEPIEGYEETFADFEKGIKGEYPYQVLNPHYLRRSHSVFDNVTWLREAWRNPVYLNADDAAKEGIADGDTVLLESPHGKVLRTACLTERWKPGVIGLPHGAWPDIDEKTGIDKGGADNILCGPIGTGQGTSGWNTCIVKISKYNEELVPDVEKPLPIFE